MRALLLLSCLAVLPLKAAPGETFHLLYWSDLHGQPRASFYRLVDSLRSVARSEGALVAAIDGGDTFFGSDLAHLTRGMAQADACRLGNPDALILGAQDFLHGRERLDTLLRACGVPLLSSNARDGFGRPYQGVASQTLELGSWKVHLLGVADPSLGWSDRPDRLGDLRIDDPEEVIPTRLGNLAPAGSDLVVAISRAGSAGDDALARSVPRLDLVIGSRDEPPAPLRQMGRTWRVRPVGGSETITRVRMTRAPDGSWLATEDRFTPQGNEASRPEWSAWQRSRDSLLQARRRTPVGSLKQAWPVTRDGAWGNWVADALREGSGAQIAWIPASLLRQGLPAGSVTLGHLWDALPSPPEPLALLEIPGSDLDRMVRRAQRSSSPLWVSGLTSTPDRSATGGPDPVILVGGARLDRSARYQVVMPGRLRDSLGNALGLEAQALGARWLPLWDRDLIEAHALRHGLKPSVNRLAAPAPRP